MRRLVGTSAGLVAWIGGAAMTVDGLMALVDAGAYLLAALGFVLALGALAACAVMTLLQLEDEPR